MAAPFSFTLPPELAASSPPERRGIARDGVRLMVTRRDNFEVEHARERSLGRVFASG